MVSISGLTDKVRSVSKKVNDVISDVDSEKQDVQKTEQNQDQSRLQEDIENQRNIFEEFEDVETDLMQLLKADKEEIDELVGATEQIIELEEEVKATTIAFGEEFDELLRITNDLNKALTEGKADYDRKIIKQALDFGFEETKEVIKEAENQMPDESQGFLLQNKLNLLIQSTGKNTSLMGTKLEDYPYLDFQKAYQESQEEFYNLALGLNRTLYRLNGRKCVDRSRFEVMEGELPELKELLEKFQGVLKKLADIEEKEKEIDSGLQTEMDEFPKSIDDLMKIGDDINKLRNGIEKEEMTEAEIEKSVSKMTSSSPETIHQEANNEISKIEQNLSNLEDFEQKIASEAVRLEEEYQRIESLTEKEEENLRKVVQEAEQVKSNINEIRDSLGSGKIGVAEQDTEREKFNDRGDVSIRMELRHSVGATLRVVDKFESQSKEVLEYINKEEKEEMELMKVGETEFSKMKDVLG